MKVVFRVDSSLEIGSGHLMRCLELGRLIKKNGARVIFLCRELEGHLSYLVEKNGFELILLYTTKGCFKNLVGYEKWLKVKQTLDVEQCIESLDREIVDLLVVDHYALDKKWEILIRPYANKVMVIDDLANREHECDVLLDQNYYENMDIRYFNLINENCRKFLGLKYVLLREEFYIQRIKKRDGKIKRIVIFFGGSDLTNETIKVLDAIKTLDLNNITIDVIVGELNKNKEKIREFCSEINGCNYYCQIENIAEIMNLADLAICAGGTNMWERCYLQLPSVVISVAENQTICCEECSKLGIIKYLGISKNIDKELILTELKKIMNDRGLYNILYEKVKAQEISTGIEEVLGFIIKKER